MVLQMRHCGEDVTEIDVKPDGSWRVRSKTESERRDLGDLCLWHSPDGTLCIPNEEVKPKMEEALKQIKQEGGSDRGLKLGIRKNSNGFWEVSRPEDINTFTSGSRLPENYGSHDQKIIPMSSSATGSRDGEDPSVNQDGCVNFDFSTNNIEMDSLSLHVDSAYAFTELNPIAPVGEVIVLSDSDEENDIVEVGTVYQSNHTDAGEVPFSMPPPGITDAYPEDPTLLSTENSCLGLFNAHDDEFGMPVWQLPPGTQGGAGFQLFGTNADVSDALVDLQHNSMNCSTMNGYAVNPEAAMSPTSLVPGSSIGRTDGDGNDSLVDNPLAFPDDPSLQIFLPTRPSDAPMQSDFRDEADVSNGVHTEDWISLRLGGDAGGSNGESTTSKGLNSRQHISSTGGEISSLADTG